MPNPKNARDTRSSAEAAQPETVAVDANYDRSAGNPAAQPSDDPRVPQPTAAPEADPNVDPDAKTVAPESQGDYYSDTTGSEQG